MTESHRKELFKIISSESNTNKDFFVRIISSSLIATFGLANNSGPVIIGGMLLAPLMLPLRGLALGAIEGNTSLIIKSIRTILVGVLISVSVAYIVTIFFGFHLVESASVKEISDRVSPTLLDLCVAIVAGAIGGYAAIHSDFSDTAAGTGIAVSLVPPLCVVGITVAQGKTDFALGAFFLFLINVIGIALACTIAFWISGPFNIRAASRNRAMYIFCALLFVTGLPLAVSFSRLTVVTFIENEAKVQLLRHTETFKDEGISSEDIEYDLISIDPTWVPPWRRNRTNEIVLRILAMEKVSPEKINQSLGVENSCNGEENKVIKPKFSPPFSSTFPLTPKTLGFIEQEIELKLKVSSPFRIFHVLVNKIDVQAKVEKIQVIEPCD